MRQGRRDNTGNPLCVGNAGRRGNKINGRQITQCRATSCSTRCGDISLRVYWRIFVKIFVSATEFCRCSKSQKFCLIWFFATCCCDLIPLRRQRFSPKNPVHTKRFVSAICRRDLLLENSVSFSLERKASERENHPTRERRDAAGREEGSPAASRLSHMGWFSRALTLHSLCYPWGKMRDYS